MANEALDGNLQWHDFINPVGMFSWMAHKAGDAWNVMTGNSSSSPSITPNEGETFEDYYNRAGGSGNSNSLWAKIDNFYNGNVDRLRDDYNTWYNEQSIYKQMMADYEMTRMLRSTEYADVVKALEAAGLNPYVLINGGFGSSSPTVSYSPAKRDNKQSSSSISGKGLLAALFLIMKLITKI